MNNIKSIGSVNTGNEYLYISKYFKEKKKSILYIARNDREIFEIQNKLKWFLPKDKINIFRSWDQIPYDNVSPSKEIQSERLKTLFEIVNNNEYKIIITSVNAIVNKIIDIDFVKQHFIKLSDNRIYQFDLLIKKLIMLGYQRTSLVRDKSEFAIRGSIIDIFLPNFKNPIRIDFDDKKILQISEFDKITQIKTKNINKELIIYPSSELLLSDVTINIFRKNFRKIFSDYQNSQVYKIFSDYSHPPGAENYTPLFYNNITSIFNYCKNYYIILNSDFDSLLENRIENINDFYESRIETGEKFLLPVNYLYLNLSEINEKLNKFKVIKINEYKIDKKNNLEIKKIPNLSSIKKEINFGDILNFFKKNNKKKIIICSRSNGSKQRIKDIFLNNLQLDFNEINHFNDLSAHQYFITVLNINESIIFKNLLLINEKTLFGYNLATHKSSKKNKEYFLEEINKYTKNSILVHSEYGFCLFKDIKKIEINFSFHECIELEFANKKKLLLPIENLNYISKYSSEFDENIKLDNLGNNHWQKRKAIAKNKIKDIAKKLMSIAAKRHNSTSYKINIDEAAYEKFTSTFPFIETEDQLKVIQEVKSDLLKSVPSDRLIVGDVAFGKTEIIIRAVYLAAISRIQSMVFVPTTLLSRQHFINFNNRLNPFGIRVKELSSFVKTKDKHKLFSDISNGKVDVVIGTHALLSEKIHFKNLGLIIYDEEQKLGTKQKEKFKSKSPKSHVISLSATPIPRTLSLSLSGIRDLSLITTAPYERLSVRCFISPFDEITIIEAIKREIYGRKNSVFYVTPRKKDIPFIEKFIKEKLPEIKYVVAHGRLKAEILEERITQFYSKKVPLLISTNIIENGLDLPHVNTIIVNRSNIFSLASLYQLKGRVGRSTKRGYAYLTYNEKELTENARKRLNIINSYDELGSGFNIASQDLNLRGSGSIIGEEQSGFIKEVGVELYHQLLEEEILLQKKQVFSKNKEIYIKPKFQPTIRIPEEIFIPDEYISDLDLRISIYKRISLLNNEKERNNIISELIDRFGKLPNQVKNLFKLIEIKILCYQYNIDKIDFGKRGILFSFFENKPKNPKNIIKLGLSKNSQFNIRKDHKVFYNFLGTLNQDRFVIIKNIISYF